MEPHVSDYDRPMRYLSEAFPRPLIVSGPFSVCPLTFFDGQQYSDMSSDTSSPGSDSSDTNSVDSRDALSQSTSDWGPTLQSRALQPITPDEAWNNVTPFQQLAASRYTLSGQANHDYRRRGSQTSSTAGSMWSRRTGSTYTPSLTGSVSTVQSRSSINTGSAPSSIFEHNVLPEDETGILHRPIAPGVLLCEFHYLDCHATFDNIQAWDDHSKAHFHGVSLPKTVHCPFRCEWTFSARTEGDEAWRQRQEHIVRAHRYGGHQIDTTHRAENSLIEHLWVERKIDRAQKQQLMRTGRLGGNSIFLQNNGRVSDARRHRRIRP